MAPRTTGDGLTDVVVTGFASATALAPDAEQTWRLLQQGHSGIRPLEYPFVERFDSPVRIGGTLRESFDDQLTRIERRRMSYLQQMATLLGRRVWGATGAPELDTRRLMVSVGLALAASEDLVRLHDDWLDRGMRAATPLAVQMHMPNAPAAAVGLEHKAKAGVITPVAADASGAMAIAEAWRHLILGEGGALLVVETEAHAKARGARILARLMGAGVTADCCDEVERDPSRRAAADAISRAVQLAGLTATDIDHVNAHATGTRDGDLCEARAIRRAMGSHGPTVYAPKAALGGAANTVTR